MVRRSAVPTLALMVGIFLMAGALGDGQGEGLGGGPVLVPGGQGQRVHPGGCLAGGLRRSWPCRRLLSVNLTPDGSRPVLVILGAGSPVAVTVKENARPVGSRGSGPLVKAGPRVTVSGVIAMA